MPGAAIMQDANSRQAGLRPRRVNPRRETPVQFSSVDWGGLLTTSQRMSLRTAIAMHSQCHSSQAHDKNLTQHRVLVLFSCPYNSCPALTQIHTVGMTTTAKSIKCKSANLRVCSARAGTRRHYAAGSLFSVVVVETGPRQSSQASRRTASSRDAFLYKQPPY